MPFMTIPEAAVLWHIPAAELRELCEKARDTRRGARASALVHPGGCGVSAGHGSRILNIPYRLNRRSFHGTNRLAYTQQPDRRR